ncbi:sigma 54-interacting transcriptional regulator [Flaviflagellibacter deserti]|uniref:Sigma 54-interacting transcriptional regulator n=1 Tax=Flaviflagellibacter deserti TaxID=2267266 RepID=A0ABV9YXU0_9HYPH
MGFAAGPFGSARRRILVAERDPAVARPIAAALAAEIVNSEVEITDTIATAEARLRGSTFSAVVVGLDLATDALERLRPLVRGPMVSTGMGSMTLAVDAMRRGSDDFLMRPFAPRVLTQRLLARMNEKPIIAEPCPAAPAGFDGFIGSSSAMRQVFAQIDRVAGSKAPVFVTGESGTGKELAAQAVHNRSGRSGSFIALNCGAIPKDLIESEIFGHVRGAFTGAVEDHAGAAELANGGTLFLDEICEMDFALQAKLLRFVQTGEVRRVGGAKAKKVDVRFVCATNRDPKAEVAAGRFREDLFYRLHVLPVQLPPLRSRGEDAMILARTFLTRLAREEQRDFTGFDPLAERMIASYSWPGNVRELESALRRVVVLNDGGQVTADMLPDEISAAVLGRPMMSGKIVSQAPVSLPVTGDERKILPMWVQEQRIIENALSAFGGNIAKAAAALEINPSTIYRKRQSWAQQTSAAE